MPFVIFRRDHLRFTSGIICGSGSFAVQFGDHFRSGDHLRSGIICGAVQLFLFFLFNFVGVGRDVPLGHETCLRTFAQKSSYGEIFFISPLELVHKVLSPKMKKNGGHRLCFGENGSGKMP